MWCSPTPLGPRPSGLSWVQSHDRRGHLVRAGGPLGLWQVATIVSLLQRFYDPHSGSISLDGHDLRTLNVQWLRSRLGLVGQEPTLFQGTVAENIRYGKPIATDAEVGG